MPKNKNNKDYSGASGRIESNVAGGSGRVTSTDAAQKGSYKKSNSMKNSRKTSRTTFDTVEQGTRILGNVWKAIQSSVATAASVLTILKVIGVVAQDAEFYSGGTPDSDDLHAQTTVPADMLGYYNALTNFSNGTRVASHDIWLTTGDKSAWASVVDTITMQLRVNMKSNLAYDADDVANAIWACVGIYLAYKVHERAIRLSYTESDYQRRLNQCVASLLYPQYGSNEGTGAISRQFFNDMTDYGSAIKHSTIMFGEFVRRKVLFDCTLFSLIDSMYGALYADSLTDNPVVNVVSYTSRYMLDRNSNDAFAGDIYFIGTSTNVGGYFNSLINSWNPIWDIVLADIVRIPGVKPHFIDAGLLNLPIPVIYDEGVRLKLRNATMLFSGTTTGMRMNHVTDPLRTVVVKSDEYKGTYIGMRSEGMHLYRTVGVSSQPGSGYTSFDIWGATRWIIPTWRNKSSRNIFTPAMNGATMIASGDFVSATGVIDVDSVVGPEKSDYAWLPIDCPKSRRTGLNMIEVTRLANRHVIRSDINHNDTIVWEFISGPEAYVGNSICVFDQAVPSSVIQPAKIRQTTSQAVLRVGVATFTNTTANITSAQAYVMAQDNECTPLGSSYASTPNEPYPLLTKSVIDYDSIAIVSAQTVQTCDEAATVALLTLRG